MSSGKARCGACGCWIKLEPCNECSTGYIPTVCPGCGGSEELEVITTPVSEEE